MQRIIWLLRGCDESWSPTDLKVSVISVRFTFQVGILGWFSVSALSVVHFWPATSFPWEVGSAKTTAHTKKYRVRARTAHETSARLPRRTVYLVISFLILLTRPAEQAGAGRVASRPLPRSHGIWKPTRYQPMRRPFRRGWHPSPAPGRSSQRQRSWPACRCSALCPAWPAGQLVLWLHAEDRTQRPEGSPRAVPTGRQRAARPPSVR